MKAQDIINTVRKKDGITQAELSAKMGKSQQSISQMISKKDGGMRVDNFVELLKIMGYEVIVRKELGKSEEWRVE